MTCPAPKALEWEAVPPGSTVECEIDLTDTLVNWHRQGHPYSLTEFVRYPGLAFELECTKAGVTGRKPILFPTAAGQTVMDGSVEWTLRDVSSSSLKATISGTPTWAVPSGYSVSGESITSNRTKALVTVPSSADGDDAVIVVTPTRSDSQVLPVYVILPVRIPQRACCA